MRHSFRVLACVAFCTATACEPGVAEPSDGTVVDLDSLATPLPDAFICPLWEARPTPEIEALVRGTLSELELMGLPIDAALWDDPARFSLLIARIYERAGCPLPADLSAAAVPREGVPDNYCGPGAGPPSWLSLRPTVDECVNRECRTHDACYDMCDGPLPRTCQWSATTAGCDDPFVARIRRCDVDDHRFSSTVVIIIAQLLNELPTPGCADNECPVF